MTLYSDPFAPAAAPAPEAPDSGIARIIEPPTITEREGEESFIPAKETLFSLPFVPPEEKAKRKKKGKRLSLESIGMLVFSLLIVVSLMAASFIASFNAILDAAQHTGTPPEWLWVFPVFIDVAIFGYTINLLIFKRRGDPVKFTIAGLIFFATLSILANFLHTFTYWNGDLSSIQAWIGVVLSISAPIAVLMASEELGRLAFNNDEDDDD